ncbi:2453_t:CDS:2 [Acaulospora morrowiae]|uniref:2453_t:CDS:1 n=1 Tax=Acaulospora morrowiae TaxID=94023 RepID=A0A9N9HEE0_9GLOM|nr:2453_t:CDS:2 [Acaulospora morrowiae]
MANDALIVTKMNLSFGNTQPKMHDSWYVNKSSKRHMQSMIFPGDYPIEELRGQSKGIKQVLMERSLWPSKKIHLVCKECSEKHDDLTKLDCCAQKILSSQPDFCEQQSMLHEAISDTGVF